MPFPKKYAKELRQEMKEHPWAGVRTAERIVLNHHGLDMKVPKKKK